MKGLLGPRKNLERAVKAKREVTQELSTRGCEGL